jgi:hypothetical protein
MLVALAGCGNPSIEEGTVYKKEHTEKHNILIPEKRGFSIVQQPYFQSERWEIYIAQCPKGEIPEQDKIKKECKTNSFVVPQEVYNNLQIGQHADFKQTK